MGGRATFVPGQIKQDLPQVPYQKRRYLAMQSTCRGLRRYFLAARTTRVTRESNNKN